MKKVVAIIGPTAVGKTDISIEIAKRYNAEVINGDSTQVYKDLNIGTAKITITEQKGIKHHLIDIVEANEEYDVSTYQKQGRKLIETIKKPLVVGGTGYYIKALLYDYDFETPKRDKLKEEEYKKYSNIELYEMLKQKDFKKSLEVHPNNRRRVLRLLLMDDSYKQRKTKDDKLYDLTLIYLKKPRKELYERINLRAEQMLNGGLLEEVKQLRNKGIKPNILGYKELNEYFDNDITIEEALELMKRNTRRYAKRQETFFKNQMEVIEIDNNEEAFDKIINILDKFW